MRDWSGVCRKKTADVPSPVLHGSGKKRRAWSQGNNTAPKQSRSYTRFSAHTHPTQGLGSRRVGKGLTPREGQVDRSSRNLDWSAVSWPGRPHHRKRLWCNEMAGSLWYGSSALYCSTCYTCGSSGPGNSSFFLGQIQGTNASAWNFLNQSMVGTPSPSGVFLSKASELQKIHISCWAVACDSNLQPTGGDRAND